MRLSAAMMLGSTVCRLEEGDINHCALGVAATAVGIPRTRKSRAGDRYMEIAMEWPWLNDSIPGDPEEFSYLGLIAERFDCEVADPETEGITWEAFVEWVAGIEPHCGECKRFDCCCRAMLVGEELEQMMGEINPASRTSEQDSDSQ